MGIKTASLVLVILLFGGGCAGARCPLGVVQHDPATGLHSVQAEVVRIIDGDTIVVRFGRHVEKVRFRYIDCPERKKPGFEEATEFTRKMIGDGPVRIEWKKRGSFGRLIAVVYTHDGRNLNRELFNAGLAKKSKYEKWDLKF